MPCVDNFFRRITLRLRTVISRRKDSTLAIIWMFNYCGRVGILPWSACDLGRSIICSGRLLYTLNFCSLFVVVCSGSIVWLCFWAFVCAVGFSYHVWALDTMSLVVEATPLPPDRCPALQTALGIDVKSAMLPAWEGASLFVHACR